MRGLTLSKGQICYIMGWVTSRNKPDYKALKKEFEVNDIFDHPDFHIKEEKYPDVEVFRGKNAQVIAHIFGIEEGAQTTIF